MNARATRRKPAWDPCIPQLVKHRKVLRKRQVEAVRVFITWTVVDPFALLIISRTATVHGAMDHADRAKIRSAVGLVGDCG